MHLRALQGLELVGSELTRPTPLLLLAYLALEGRQTRQHLGELFWLGAANPLGSLSMALTQLRKAAPELVVADDASVEARVTCDAQVLLQALYAGEDERGLGLYDGPFLDGVHLRGWGVELEEWVLVTRELIAGRVRAAMLNLAEEAAARGRFADAARRAEAAYALRGAPALEPEDIERLHTLLKAGASPLVRKVQAEAEEYDLQLVFEKTKARGQLIAARPSPSLSSLQPRTSFVGRDLELSEVAASLTEPSTRVLTLFGPAGVGKTRLALQVAADQLKLGAFPGGIHVVALEPVASPGGLLPALVQALGRGEQTAAHDATEQLSDVATLLGSEETLLLFDGFEHLASVATILSDLAQLAPNVTMLVTSRERLNIEEEVVFPVDGLVVTPAEQPPLEEALHSDAVRLFVRRAKRSNPAFDLTEENLPAALRICRHVEGLPLGIELAAVWVRTLPLPELAAELERGLDILVTPSRNVSERNRSLRGAFEHSWQLLSETERTASRRLATMVGGFGREAAAAVAGTNIPLLGALVDKSLLRVGPTGRYDWHPLLHEFTAEKLAEDRSEVADARNAHARYFAAFLDDQRQRFSTSEVAGALNALDTELSNLISAAGWLAANGGGDLLVSMSDSLRAYFDLRKRYLEGVELFEGLVRADAGADAGPVVHGTLLRDKAWLMHLTGRHEAAKDGAREALELVTQGGESSQVAKCHNVLASCSWFSADYESAQRSWRAALELATSAGDEAAAAALAANLSLALHALGDLNGAREQLESSLRASREQQDGFHVVRTLNKLGVLQIDLEELSAAEGSFTEAMEMATELGLTAELPRLQLNLGIVAYERHDLAAARRLTLSALDGLTDSDDRDLIAYANARLGRVAAAFGEGDAAERHLARALSSGDARPSLQVEVVAACAELRERQRRPHEAAALLHLISRQPDLEATDRTRYRKRFEEVAAQLSEGAAEEARSLGESLTLEGAIGRFLAGAAK